METKKNQRLEKNFLLTDSGSTYLLRERASNLKWLGIFYAPAGGNVHRVAKMLKTKITSNPVDIFCIPHVEAHKLLEYKNLILVSSSLGRSTWEREQRDQWARFFPAMRRMTLHGRKVALIGLGDHIAYPSHFVNGLGYMAKLITQLGGEVIGRTSAEGYEFVYSSALEDNLFMGLPLDEDYETEKTETRLNQWLSSVLPEFEEDQ